MQTESPVFLVFLFDCSNEQIAFSGGTCRSIPQKNFQPAPLIIYIGFQLLNTRFPGHNILLSVFQVIFTKDIQRTARYSQFQISSFHNMSISPFLFHLVPPTLDRVAVCIPPYHCFLIFPSFSIFLSPPFFCFSHPFCNLSWLFEGKKHKVFFMHQSVLIG